MPKETNPSIKRFFTYLIVGYFSALVRGFDVNMPAIKFVEKSTKLYLFCLVMGIYCGLAYMFGYDLYYWLKKKSLIISINVK